MARLKELEDENRRLKKMYAEEHLKAEIVQEALQKKLMPSRRKEMAQTVVAGQLSDGRSYRPFNVIDDYRREGFSIEAGFSLPSMRVIRTLSQLIEWRGPSSVISCDNGPEFISRAFSNWARKHGIRLEYIQPGKPQQNAYPERHDSTIRYRWVSTHRIETLEEVQDYATQWLWFYNHERPHKANGGRPPLRVA